MNRLAGHAVSRLGARASLLALSLFCAVSPAPAQQTDTNWALKGGDFSGQHYSALKKINVSNIDNLGLAWASDLPIPDGVATTPIVIDGVVYLSGAYSFTLALDAKSGDILWSYDPEVRDSFAEQPLLSWLARAHRGIAVSDGKLFVTTVDCRLIALDAKKGTRLWSQQTCDTALGYFITDSPYVGGDKVFVGNGGSESQLKGRGYVSAFAADDGDLLWRFYIVPSDKPEENDTPAMKMAAKTWSGAALAKYGGGGHSWNEMTYDPVSKLLFFGTSGAYPYRHAERSPLGGDNLFLSSIVAVDTGTGEYRWHYQTVDKDSWDYNATMNVVLADLTINEVERETVLLAPKNGFHYTLDRHTGELLAVGKFAKTNWATDVDLETGKPIYNPQGEYWNLAEGEEALIWPNSWGARNWTAMAFHPGQALSYIPVIDVPGKRSGGGGEGEALVMVTEVDGKPHAPGKLVAMDPTNGRIRWSVDRDLPFNGGLLATDGDLVFQGTALGTFEAFSAGTGEPLWSVQTGSAINAAPVSYSLGGVQYILIPIGAGGGLQYQYPGMHSTKASQGPTRLLAFTIGGEAQLASGPSAERTLPDQPKLDASPEVIVLGAEVYNEACKFCHGSNAVARFGGTVPDLRYADSTTHAQWDAIVIGGSKVANGMPVMELTVEQSHAVRNYVLSLSEKIHQTQ
ncbi:MAG: PQQ-dependent dehydrogenase, methanol/ethanol family [Gammaproteobacteria bacterium]|jgi:quinohemoprotein ethanol dehydrogenase|nr:PQQ-dependent dehydrogenase, methanol/ethanol family [Gammaproteobacteria bacterium]|tara:strand:+ start:1530 stop:3584 length:2055 start_codon:yes stop_codon:yes gene_type:complete